MTGLPLILYLQKQHRPEGFDVVAYRDADGAERAARWPWWQSNRPDRRNRWVTFNCYRWRVEWLPDVPAPPDSGHRWESLPPGIRDLCKAELARRGAA